MKNQRILLSIIFLFVANTCYPINLPTWDTVIRNIYQTIKNRHFLAGEIARLPDADPEAQEFVRNELRKGKLSKEQVKNLNIKVGRFSVHTYFSAYSHLNTLSVPINKEHLEEIPAGLKEEEQEVAKEFTHCLKNHCRWSIAHEAGHLYYKHACKELFCEFLAYCCTLYSIHQLFGKHIMLIIATLDQLIQLTLEKQLINTAVLVSPISKYQEYQADQYAIQTITDPQVLKAGKYYLLQHHEKIRKNIPTWKRKLYDCFPVLYEILVYSEHPSSTRRAKWYGQAAARLEKNKKNKLSRLHKKIFSLFVI